MDSMRCQKRHSGLWLAAFASLLISLSGCSSDSFEIAKVSGVVKMDGQPLSGVDVVFGPVGSKENINPGPFAKGTTDESGRFELRVRGEGKLGAGVGENRVGISYGSEDSFDVRLQDEIKNAVDAANKKGVLFTEDDIDRIAEDFKSRESVATEIPESYKLKTMIRLIVPADGTQEANFDLKSDGSSLD